MHLQCSCSQSLLACVPALGDKASLAFSTCSVQEGKVRSGRPCVNCDARWGAGGQIAADSTLGAAVLLPCHAISPRRWLVCSSQFKKKKKPLEKCLILLSHLELKIPRASPIRAEHRLKSETRLDGMPHRRFFTVLRTSRNRLKGIVNVPRNPYQECIRRIHTLVEALPYRLLFDDSFFIRAAHVSLCVAGGKDEMQKMFRLVSLCTQIILEV